MGATLAAKTFILRAGENHDRYGDPYEFAAHVLLINNLAYVEGAAGHITRQLLRDIEAELLKIGAKRVVWDRKINGFDSRAYQLGDAERVE